MSDPAAQTIAIDHVLWCASQGLSARQVIYGVGRQWPKEIAPSWHDAVMVLAVAWRLVVEPREPYRRVA